MSELTAGQQEGLDKISEFFENPEEKFFSLLGPAGSGKSYLTQRLIQQIPGHQAILAAPTNKAVKVLHGFNKDFTCLTIHKFLGVKPVKSKGTTKLVVKKTYDPTEWINIKYVLLDEASMIPDDLFRRIERDARDWGRKYLFIGDPYQLPPIDHTETKCFKAGLSFELTEIVRQALGNPIIAAATAVRLAIIEGSEPKILPGINEDGLGVQVVNRKEFERMIQEAFSEEGQGQG